ncbi:MAG: Uncharacterized protein FD140_4256 [Limisphaerales bacterium]|nr:MAG: Uncharacterized protein FD140_4256 [Limisphaerales bacterium]
MLLPALSKAKEKATGIKCVNNMKQLGLAWSLYSSDQDGRLINNYAAVNGSWVLGNMSIATANTVANTNIQHLIDTAFVQTGNRFTNLTLGRELSGNFGVFKCPADKSQDRGNKGNRVRSVAMNQGVGFNVTATWLPATAGWKTYRRDVDITSRTFVFVDEHPQSINDGGFAVRGVDPAQPGTWGLVDFPAVYHNKASSFNFGDGHAEIKRWQDGTTTRLINYSGPQIGGWTPLPNNPDSLWLSQAATE